LERMGKTASIGSGDPRRLGVLFGIRLISFERGRKTYDDTSETARGGREKCARLP
jgi:hypothetical protein